MALASTKPASIPVRRYRANSDINVTPFVDVMLVLLIIFMIVAPLATTAVLVDTPPPGPEALTPSRPIFVSLSESGEIYVAREGVGEKLCVRSKIVTCIGALTKGNVSERINVRADPGVRYGEVVLLMDAIKGGGYEKLALITEEPQ
jgi:biopolymer transport protein ExbD